MSACKQELCGNWSGEGDVCPCALFDLTPDVNCEECGMVQVRLGEVLCPDCKIDAADDPNMCPECGGDITLTAYGTYACASTGCM